ncbi:type 4 pilus major pilin [Escherichia coli]|uniref:type 4 pilus major pilin n=1 Tax=Escherichia coli TaxID=562 RepID=UPI002FCD262E
MDCIVALSRTGVANESSNIQTIITSTQGLLKGSDGYTFTSGDQNDGCSHSDGCVPKTMTVRGTPSSGTATLYNSWGGAVTVAPASTSVSTMVLPSPMKKSTGCLYPDCHTNQSYWFN